MRANNRYVFCTTLTAVLLSQATATATDGYQLIGIGAVQKATAGAGVASPKDASWALLNPAGLALLDRRFDLGAELFWAKRTMKPDGPALPQMGGQPLANSSQGRSCDDSPCVIPSGGTVLPVTKGAIGVGFYGVCGASANYRNPRTTIPATMGQSFDRRTDFCVGKLAVAYSYPLGDGLFVGGAVNGDIATLRTDMLTGSFMPTQGDFRQDQALGGGFQLGILKKLDRWSFGGTYVSRQWMEEFDKYDDLFKESLDLPQMVQIGIAWRALEDMEILADYKYINWSGVDQLGDSPESGGFGWSDQHIVKLGAVWEASDDLRLSAGYSYGRSPIDEEVVFANALFPAIAEHHVSLGAGLDLSKASALQVTYMHAFENTLVESGEGDMYSVAGKGTEISLEENTLTLQYSLRF